MKDSSWDYTYTVCESCCQWQSGVAATFRSSDQQQCDFIIIIYASRVAKKYKIRIPFRSTQLRIQELNYFTHSPSMPPHLLRPASKKPPP